MKFFITNFNLIALPLAMIRYLQQIPGLDIFVIDNASTRPDMGRIYGQPGVNVIRMDANYGPWVLWERGIVEKTVGPTEAYCASDPDLDLTGVPLDFVDRLKAYIDRGAAKAGLSLETRDLGNSLVERKAKHFQAKYWVDRYDAGAWRAAIDTTIHMRIGHQWIPFGEGLQVRLDRPYTCRHAMWYPDRWDDEMRHYFRTAEGGWWSTKIRLWYFQRGRK